MAIKRQCYVHSYVQLICQCTYDPEISMESVSMVILNLLTDIETVVASGKLFISPPQPQTATLNEAIGISFIYQSVKPKLSNLFGGNAANK